MASIKRTEHYEGHRPDQIQPIGYGLEHIGGKRDLEQANAAPFIVRADRPAGPDFWRIAWLIISILQLAAVFLMVGSLYSVAKGQDLTWQRDGKTMADFATSASDTDRANVIRAAIDLIRPKLLPTDTLIARERADFGSRFPLYLPPCILKNGGNANWFTSVKIDKTADKPQGTPGFVFPTPGRIELQGMKFSGTCIDPNEDGGLAGYDETPGAAELLATGCEFDGSNGIDWVVYFWTAGPKVATFKGCTIRHARKGICGEGSGSASQNLTVEDCTFIGDANGSKTFGESSGPDKDNGGVLAAIEIRGGSLSVRNCTFSLVGLAKPYTPPAAASQYGCLRMAAVNDSFYSPGQANIPILLDRLTVTMQPTRYTPNAKPVDVRFSTPVWAPSAAVPVK